MLVPNCPGAKLFVFTMFVPNCPFSYLGAKLSVCLLGVKLYIFTILVPNCPVPNCPVPNCPTTYYITPSSLQARLLDDPDITKKMIGNRPNTYTFTKVGRILVMLKMFCKRVISIIAWILFENVFQALAESLLATEASGLPVRFFAFAHLHIFLMFLFLHLLKLIFLITILLTPHFILIFHIFCNISQNLRKCTFVLFSFILLEAFVVHFSILFQTRIF